MVVTLNLNFQLVWPCLNHDEGEEDGRGLCTSCNRRVVNFGKMEFKAKRERLEVRQHKHLHLFFVALYLVSDYFVNLKGSFTKYADLFGTPRDCAFTPPSLPPTLAEQTAG